MSAENGHRWSKFWWGDYQNCTELRLLNLAARGYWMELLCVMHSASPTGHLLIGGKQPTHAQLAAIAGCTTREAKRLEAALEAVGVFSRTTDGVIYCRRMVRDSIAAEHGKAGAERRWKGKRPNGLPNGLPNDEPYSQAYRNPNARYKSTEAEAERKMSRGPARDDTLRGASQSRQSQLARMRQRVYEQAEARLNASLSEKVDA